MTVGDALQRGRESFERKAWGDAHEGLAAADADKPLALDDLEKLALAAYMAGKEYECARAWTRAHHECIRQNDPIRAARCAFWQAAGLIVKGDMAPAMGWIARGRRMLEDYQGECAEKAWLLVLTGLPIMFQGDPAAALPNFIEAEASAARLSDPDVTTFARLARGTALVYLGEVATGMSLLDEIMIAVTSGEVSPILGGIAYCQVIAICQEIFDLRRAREWTAALSSWCDSQPGLVPFRGNCLVHRCEILRLEGSWPEALDAAQQACEWLAGPNAWDTLGSAYYQLGEMQRLHGKFEDAEESYRRASQSGRDPEPGMSLLRLADGRVDLAAASVRRVAEEAQGREARARVLPAYVEIMLAAGDVRAARTAAQELSEIASSLDVPYVHALAAQATGEVLIAESDHRAARDALRSAWRIWQEIKAPYEAARVRAMTALACQGLGDAEGAALELDAASRAFRQLGAATDLARAEKLSKTSTVSKPGGLTAREADVLRLLAKGMTNREISVALTISEHTVARHVQNILLKLGVSSRTAASAFAFENDLV